MDVIERKRGSERIKSEVYTKEEADRKGIPYVHWQKCRVNDWGITDDEWVGQCVNLKEYHGRDGKVRKFITFTFGRAWIYPSTRLEYEPYRFIKGYSMIKPANWIDREVKRRRTKTLISAYVAQSMTGKVDFKVLGQLYRPDQKIPEATVKRLLKQEKIQKMIKEELRELLKEKGIDEGYVVDIMKRAAEVAEKREDAGNMLKAADMLGGLLKIRPEDSTPLLPSFQVTQFDKILEESEKELKNLELPSAGKSNESYGEADVTPIDREAD